MRFFCDHYRKPSCCARISASRHLDSRVSGSPFARRPPTPCHKAVGIEAEHRRQVGPRARADEWPGWRLSSTRGSASGLRIIGEHHVRHDPVRCARDARTHVDHSQLRVRHSQRHEREVFPDRVVLAIARAFSKRFERACPIILDAPVVDVLLEREALIVEIVHGLQLRRVVLGADVGHHLLERLGALATAVGPYLRAASTMRSESRPLHRQRHEDASAAPPRAAPSRAAAAAVQASDPRRGRRAGRRAAKGARRCRIGEPIGATRYTPAYRQICIEMEGGPDVS